MNSDTHRYSCTNVFNLCDPRFDRQASSRCRIVLSSAEACLARTGRRRDHSNARRVDYVSLRRMVIPAPAWTGSNSPVGDIHRRDLWRECVINSTSVFVHIIIRPFFYLSSSFASHVYLVRYLVCARPKPVFHCAFLSLFLLVVFWTRRLQLFGRKRPSVHHRTTQSINQPSVTEVKRKGNNNITSSFWL